MNKHLYRIIYNKTRAMLMVVTDIAGSAGKPGSGTGCGQRAWPAVRVLKLTALRLSMLLITGGVSLSAHAHFVADPHAPGEYQPSIGYAANGIAQIDIQTPNEQGVSHNVYQQFDVDPRGVVLNNSRQDVATQLGGLVTANDWLARGEASVIINEVNSPHASHLNGMIEVAGRSAEVVIANPQGIIANGSGFINAHHATLAAGRVIMEDGRIKAFDVDRGEIRFEGKGMDMKHNHALLIARAVQANAEVRAKNLTIATGRNLTDREGNVVQIKPDDGAAPASYALDVAAVGGMYVDKIKLLGTERGMGVHNAGHIGSGIGEITLTVNGQLENSGAMSSTADLFIATTQGDLHNQGRLASYGDIQLEVANALHHSGELTARGNIRANADRVHAADTSQWKAGTDEHSIITQPGSLLINAKGVLQLAGTQAARDNIVLSAATVDLSSDQRTTHAQSISITAAQGEIRSDGARVSGASLSLNATGAIHNDHGHLSADALAITTQDLSNRHGLIQQTGPQDLVLSHGSPASDQGKVTGSLDNTHGQIIAIGGIKMTTGQLTNASGNIDPQGSALVSAQQLDNTRGYIQSPVNTTVSSHLLNNTQGRIDSDGDVSVRACALENSDGHVEARGDAVLTAQTLGNTRGHIIAGANTVIDNGANGTLINYNGQIQSAGNIKVTTQTLDNTDGHVNSSGDALLTAQLLNNTRGKILSKGHATITGSNVNNTEGHLQAGGDAWLTAQLLENAGGKILAGRDAIIDNGANGTLINRNGQIQSAGDITVTTQTLDNTDGHVNSSGDALLTAQLLNNTRGKILSKGHATITGSNVNNTEGHLQAGGDAWLTAQLLENAGGKILAGRDAVIDNGANGTLINYNGQIQSAGDIKVTTQTLDNTDGHILAGVCAAVKNPSTDSGTLNNRIDQDSAAPSNASITTQTLHNNRGKMQASGETSLNSERLDNSYGEISAANNASITAQTLDNTSGIILAGLNLAIVNGANGNLINRAGLIQAKGDASVLTHTLNNIDGKFLAGQNASLASDNLDNTQGEIQAKSTISAATQTLNNTRGGILTGGELTISNSDPLGLREFVNRHGRIRSGRRLKVDTGQGPLDNQHGLLNSATQGELHACSLDNRHGTISIADAASLRISERLDNRAGTLRSDLSIALTASDLDNSDTRQETRGIAAPRIIIDAQRWFNVGGKLWANEHLAANLAQTLDNRQGDIAAHHTLRLQDAAPVWRLMADNRDGRILAGQQGFFSLHSLTGDGRIHSDGDLSVRLRNDFHLTSRMSAVGALTLGTTGDISNEQYLNGQRSLSLSAGSLTNTAAAQIAGGELQLNLRDTVNNAGMIEAGGTLILTTPAHIHNEYQISSQRGMSMNAASLMNTAAGKIAGGELQLDLRDTVHNAGMIEAGGTLMLTTPAHIHNEHQISSQRGMSMNAASLMNSAAGRIANGSLQLYLRETLNNTGEISADGNARVNANQIANTGGGRIYGEHVALQARRVENTASEGRASVVAARERLDIGAGDIINRDQSLLTSVGDLSIGGGLDERNRAVGRAGNVENHHAEISADGQMTLGANTLINTNAGMTLGKKNTRTRHHEGVLKGHTQRHKWSEIDRQYKNKYGVHDAIMPDGSRDNQFYEYRYTRTITDDVVTHSQPGKILAGGALTIEADLVINRDSQINAGGALFSQVGELRNEATPGQRRIVDQGMQWRWYAKKSGGGRLGGTKTSQGRDRSRYRPLPRVESLDLKQVSWQADSPLQRRKASLPAGAGPVHLERAATLDGLWDHTGIIRAVIPDESPLYFMPLTLTNGQIYEQPLLLALENDQSGMLPSLSGPDNDQSGMLPSLPAEKNKPRPVQRVRVIKPVIALPTNSLFKLYPSQNHQYLVETDPQFTQYKRWIGSDYMNAKLRFNPSLTHKRLGDGFYEQRLVRDQIMQLTGQRYLPGHANDNEQFKALMNAGVQFAQAHELTPGVMLSPRQMALLTSDMVWLVAQTVTLADGSQQEVLVPQVYARTHAGDLSGDGALLSGQQLQLNVAGGLYNQGSIGGRQTAGVTAQHIDNSGLMAGQQLDIHARQDYQQSGGQLVAEDALSLTSGGDIQVQSTLRGDEQNRWLDRHAGIYVQNADGTLELTAQNTIRLAAAELAAKGANSRIDIMAGGDVQLQALETAKTENASWGAGNYRHVSQQTQVGSQITGQGDIALSAGQDITAVAAGISAQDLLGLKAGGDINLLAGVKQSSVIDHQEQSDSNAFSAFALTLHDEVHERRALASKLEGEQFNAAAGRDLTVQGGSLVSTQDLDLSAGRNLILSATDETRAESHLSLEQDSGLMSGGGIGVSVGNASLKQTQDSYQRGQQGSVAGSIYGDVRLNAGGQVDIHASDLIAGGDLSLSGADVSLTAAENLLVQHQTMEQQKSGLTLALSGKVGGAVNNAFTAIQQAADNQSGRLGMLLGTKAALSGVQAVQAGQMAAADVADTDAVGVSLSYGSQSSKSEQTLTQRESQVSGLTAGNNLTIMSTGNGLTGHAGDILMQGSQIQAGQKMTLDAHNDLLLSSAQNTQKLVGENSSKGGSVGVGVGVGKGGWGINVSASINRGRGSESGDGTSYTETQINAGKQVDIVSGRDMVLTGAQVSGETITADVGRNLLMQSQQDSDRYDAQQQNVSAGASFSLSPMSGSASVNMSRDKLHSNYRSVQNQTGLFAGPGGFEIQVGQHTQLDGAVIASTAKPGDNRLETGTLGFSNIENQAEFKAEHQSAGFSTGASAGWQFAGNMANNLLTGANNSGQASSTTRAAVSDGTLIIRDRSQQQQDIAQLSRDGANAAGVLSPIFDKEKEQQRLQQAQLIGEIANQVMDIARTQGELNGLAAARKELGELSPDASKQERKDYMKTLRDSKAYKAVMKDYGTGSSTQKAVQAVTGAIQGVAGGNLAQAITGAMSPYIAEEIKTRTTNTDQSINKEANIMAHALWGGVTAYASGNSALAGAAGAAAGELAAMAIVDTLYPGVKIQDLSEAQKQTLSALSTVSAALAGGLTGNGAGDMVAGAQAGKNAVENNFLLAVPAPPPPVAVQNTTPGAAGNRIEDDEIGGGCEGSREACSVRDGTRGTGRAENTSDGSDESKPNLGKDIARASHAEKAELGGVGSGTPDGWGPGDEESARKSASAVPQKLNSQLTAEEIANGHAFDKHVLRQGEFDALGIRTRAQFQNHVEKVVNKPTDVRYYNDGRVAYLDESTRTVVIKNPNKGESTAFRPDFDIGWDKYIKLLPSQKTPPTK